MSEEPTSLHAIHCLQIMLCTMLGGGSLGRLAAEHPAPSASPPGRNACPIPAGRSLGCRARC